MKSTPLRPVPAILLLLVILAVSGLTSAPGADTPAIATPAAVDSVPIASYTFDDGFGGPDPMGWTTVDVTEQLGTFFHVDDFSGLGGGDKGGLLPLTGARSMWCGARQEGAWCSYAAFPGYGNNWDQRLTSTPFPVLGDVEVTFLARFDSEPGYDYTYVEYLTQSDRWQTVESFYGNGYGPPLDSLVSITIPEDSLAGFAKIRIRFTSDGAFSDADGLFPTDGAVIIDSLVVNDATGTVDYQDFEADAVGATQTSDGDWVASAGPAFGDFAALTDGSTVLQEDSAYTDTTYMWTFFNGSTDPWDCFAPDTGLVAVPNPNERGQRLYNLAASPVLDISSLLSGGTLPDSLTIWVGYDVYRDFDLPEYPLIRGMRHTIAVRSLSNGCWSQWLPVTWEQGGTGEWIRFDYDITFRILPDATHIQVGVGAGDGYVACHSQAPFIDNVQIYARNVVATGVGDDDSTPHAYVLHQNLPNPFNPTTTIAFDIPPPGVVVNLRIYDVAGRLVQTLRDGYEGPGPHAVDWDGRNRAGARVASGVYFYRLDAPGFSQTRKMVLLK